MKNLTKVFLTSFGIGTIIGAPIGLLIAKHKVSYQEPVPAVPPVYVMPDGSKRFIVGGGELLLRKG